LADDKSKLNQTRTVNPTRTFVIDGDGDSDFAMAMARRAAKLLDRGDPGTARRCLKLGLKRVPEHLECLTSLAVCAAMEKQKLAAAEKLARRILEDHPREARAHYALGRVNLLGSRRRSAFRHFQRARTLAWRDENLKEELASLDPRRRPALRFLSRDNRLNIWLGKLWYAFLRVLAPH